MRRNLVKSVAFAIAVLLLPVRVSFGWHATGHIVISLIAWQDLTPKTKAAVANLLKQHARYQKDLLDDLPQDSTADETDRFVFAKASTWPDMVRLPGNPMHATHNHPEWHYIDIPYYHGVPHDVPATSAPASSQAQSDQTGPRNIVEALQKCTADMKDESVSPAERAVALCWVEHLVGDIHQPLHAATLFSPEHPAGDRGGNDDVVLREPPFPNSRDNLHSIWDGIPGEFHSQMIDGFEASGLRSDPKFSRAALKPMLDAKDFMAWANESHQLAIEDVYLNGQLETAVVQKESPSASADSVPGLPPGYMEKAEVASMQRVALAGYRLADLLNAAFDSKP